MTEVTFEVSTKQGQKKLPQFVSLTEAIRTVVSHQTATGTYPPNKSSVAFPTDENKGRALFVSRMHPKKGVLELVESWARVFGGSREEGVGGKETNWQCELVYTLNGETEREYEQRVKQRILELGMAYQDKDGTNYSSTSTANFNSSSPDFIFTGPLDDDAKWEAYGRADLFVLPTYSEIFGIVVAEALWAGLPVITTKGTPWSELEGNIYSSTSTSNFNSAEGRCGWWIELPGGESSSSNFHSSTSTQTNQTILPGLPLILRCGRRAARRDFAPYRRWGRTDIDWWRRSICGRRSWGQWCMDMVE